MGIPNLNRYLKQHCKSSINMIELSELKGKVIVIDISIYLYRYVAENALVENVYLLLSIFRHYNIRPIFIFDGMPPDEKLELLKKRKADKVKSEAEYNELKKKLSQSNSLSFEEKQDPAESLGQELRGCAHYSIGRSEFYWRRDVASIDSATDRSRGAGRTANDRPEPARPAARAAVACGRRHAFYG